MKLPVWKPLYYALKVLGCPVVWETSVGAVIFRSVQGKRIYLLLHYPSGHFDFAKGHVEAGETEEMTLRRETQEETGITDLRVFSEQRVSISYFYAAKGTEREKRLKSGHGIWIFKDVHFYPAETKTEKIILSPREHQGFAWEYYDAALKRLTFFNAKRVLMETEEYLKNSQAS